MNAPGFITHLLFLATSLTMAQLLLRTAIANAAGAGFMQLILSQWLLVLAALLLFGVNFFYYTFALQQAPIAALYPAYTAMTLVLVFLAGVLLFHESASPLKVSGLVLICPGIFLIQPG